MSINTEAELIGIKQVSDAVAFALKEMVNFAEPGMSTKHLDDFAAEILKKAGARSAPQLAYKPEFD